MLGWELAGGIFRQMRVAPGGSSCRCGLPCTQTRVTFEGRPRESLFPCCGRGLGFLRQPWPTLCPRGHRMQRAPTHSCNSGDRCGCPDGKSSVPSCPGAGAAGSAGLKRGRESWEGAVLGFAPAKLSETKNGSEAWNQEFQVASTFHFSWYFSVSTACSWLKPSSAYSANKLK